jgi:hypothetical protein
MAASAYEAHRDELFEELTPRSAELILSIIEMGENERSDFLDELRTFITQATEDDQRCPQGCECPRCGEHKMDQLAIDLEDDDYIDCQSCGQRYRVEVIGIGQGFRAIPVERSDA